MENYRHLMTIVVWCRVAATNTNCQWKLEHCRCLHIVIFFTNTRSLGSILHRMLSQNWIRGNNCCPC